MRLVEAVGSGGVGPFGQCGPAGTAGMGLATRRTNIEPILSREMLLQTCGPPLFHMERVVNANFLTCVLHLKMRWHVATNASRSRNTSFCDDEPQTAGGVVVCRWK